MPIPSFILRNYLRACDLVSARITQPPPSPEALRQCKTISHRGDHDNRTIKENTFAAFERAEMAGVWGIELDLRWTRDLEPIVFHDADLYRMFGVRKNLSISPFSEIRKHFPAIPALSEVAHRFGKSCHLMIEVKKQPWLNCSKQVNRILDILSPLEPIEDYHLITMHPEMLAPFREIPTPAHLAISEGYPARKSRWVKKRQWGGLCGHYLLLGDHMMRTHHDLGQKVGTGYIQSRNCLFREINRGVDWIFSNAAVRLQQILNTCAIS